MLGKIATALLLADAAYKPLDEFIAATGLTNTQLLTDKKTDTTVRSDGPGLHSEMPACRPG